MSNPTKNFELINAIICDDIRREDNGKAILIGVYGANIILRSFPSVVPLSVWVQLDVQFSGKHEIEFKIITPTEDVISGITVVAKIPKPGGVIIPVPKFVATFEEEGELVVEMCIDDGEWTKIRSLKVELTKEQSI